MDTWLGMLTATPQRCRKATNDNLTSGHRNKWLAMKDYTYDEKMRRYMPYQIAIVTFGLYWLTI